MNPSSSELFIVHIKFHLIYLDLISSISNKNEVNAITKYTYTWLAVVATSKILNRSFLLLTCRTIINILQYILKQQHNFYHIYAFSYFCLIVKDCIQRTKCISSFCVGAKILNLQLLLLKQNGKRHRKVEIAMHDDI